MDNCPHCEKKLDSSEHGEKKKVLHDPVCGMSVGGSSSWKTQYEDKEYHFCSEKCLKSFEANPAKNVSEEETVAPSPVVEGAVYTCPMHPQIKQDHPGSCPICGMALEPEIPVANPGEDPELVDFRKRFYGALPFSLALLVLGMGGHLFQGMMSEQMNIIQLILSLPVVLWAGSPLFVRGWKSVVTRNPNMWTLIILGTTVAFGYSIVATFFPGIFPAEFLHHGQLAVYFEAAALIISLSLLGQIFELKARSRTSDAIRSLLDLSPRMARIILPDGQEKDIPVSELHVGDRLRVRPGEKVPVDGVIQEGTGDLDESMITGEYASVAKGVGQKVIGGTLNSVGSFVMQANHVGKDTVLARIVSLVAQAQHSRAPIQQMVDVVARYFVITVISIAVLTFLIWGVVGPTPSWDYALINAVSVLIVACPCALGLATPMSIMVASGKAATLGVLFRDAEAMQELSEIDTLVLDKTGTLTEGKPGFSEMKLLPGFDENTVLSMAAALERGSEHPLAQAIVKEAERRALPGLSVTEFKAWPGGGVTGVVDGKKMVLGTGLFCSGQGADASSLSEQAQSLQSEGKGVVFIAEDNKIVGLIAVQDQIKNEAFALLDELKKGGIRVILASGDAQATVDALAKKLSLSDARGEMTPEMKLDLIKDLRSEGRTVGMAGDGVNDAPALAEANVGIAMGTGTDIAMQSGGVTLIKGDLGGIERARLLACATMKNMKSNLWLAFVYNALGIPIAAGVLYPHFGILLSPVFAAVAMSLSSVSVILNALRLRSFGKAPQVGK